MYNVVSPWTASWILKDSPHRSLQVQINTEKAPAFIISSTSFHGRKKRPRKELPLKSYKTSIATNPRRSITGPYWRICAKAAHALNAVRQTLITYPNSLIHRNIHFLNNRPSTPSYLPPIPIPHHPSQKKNASSRQLTDPRSNNAEKSSWWGCGQHIPSVMDPIPEANWCTCDPKVERGGKQYPPMAANADWLPAWLCNALVGGASKDGSREEL